MRPLLELLHRRGILTDVFQVLECYELAVVGECLLDDVVRNSLEDIADVP